MRCVCSILSVCLIVLGFVCSGCKPSENTDLESNKALMRRVVKELNEPNWQIIDELFAPDFVYHQPGSPTPLTRRQWKQSVRSGQAAFPDGYTTIEDMIAEADKVVVRATFRGTHEGDLSGIAATGEEVAMTQITIARIADGKVAEVWEEYDALGLMRQIGGLTELTMERDSAVAEMTNLQGLVEKLRAQLAEQTKKATELEAQNKRLQQTINSLLGAGN